MAEVIALAAAAGSALATASAATIVQGVLVASSVGYSISQSRKMRRAQNASLQDRTSPIRSSNEPRKIVIGRTRVSDVVVYNKEWGPKRQNQSIVIALAAHEIDAVEEIWFNDESIAPWDPITGQVQSGSKFFLAQDFPYVDTWIGGAANSTRQLNLEGAAGFRALDTLVYTTPVETHMTYPNGEGGAYLMGGNTVVLERNVDFTVSAGGLVTLLNAKAQGNVVTATYRVDIGQPLVSVRVFRGVPAGERDTDLESWSGGEWASTALGRDVARIRVTCVWHETVFANGFPSISAVVRGARLYDPRQDSTNGGSGSHRVNDPSTWTYGTHSDNPALVAAFYFIHKLGWRLAPSKIDWPSVIEAANICDELVPIDGVGGVQKRYTCSGVLSTGDSRKSNLQQILSAMLGTAFRSGGKWFIRAAAYRTPTLSLDASDLAEGSFRWAARVPRRDLVNSVRGTFRDPAKRWVVTDFPPYRSSTYVVEDGNREYWRDIELPFTHDVLTAQRISKLTMFRERQAVAFTATWKISAYSVQPGDNVMVTLPYFGWTNKVFRVVNRTIGSLRTVTLLLREEVSAVYAWDYSEQTNPDPAPNTSLPDPSYVPPLTGVTVTSNANTFYVRQDGVVVPYVEIGWALPTMPDVRVEVLWKFAHETEYRVVRRSVGDVLAWLEGVAPGDVLNVYLYAINPLGARSVTSWLQSVTVSPDVPSGRPSISANLLRNASFDYGAANWGIYESGVANVTTIARHATSGYFIPGTPTSAYITIASTLTGNLRAGGARSVPVSCSPGEWVVAYASLIGWGTNALSTIAWYDTSGARIGGTDGNVIVGWPVEAPQRRFDRIADYEVSAVLAQAPANAKYAELVVIGTGAWDSGPFKYVSIHKPFIGKLPAGVRELPPWDGGSASMVATPDIIPGAISDEYVSSADGIVLAFTGSPDLQFQGPTLTPVVSGILHIDCSFTLHAVANVSDGVGWDAYLFPEAGTPKSALTERGFLMTLPANAADVRSFSRTTSIPVVAGQSVSTRLLIVRRGLNETTPVTATGPQSKNVTLWRAAGSVYNLAFRATMNKR